MNGGATVIRSRLANCARFLQSHSGPGLPLARHDYVWYSLVWLNGALGGPRMNMSIACFKCGTLNQVPEESSRFQCANCRELNAVPTAGEGALQRGHTRTRTGRTNGLAIASLILSLVGAGLLGLIFGYVAKGQIKQTGDDGDGL